MVDVRAGHESVNVMSWRHDLLVFRPDAWGWGMARVRQRLHEAKAVGQGTHTFVGVNLFLCIFAGDVLSPTMSNLSPKRLSNTIPHGALRHYSNRTWARD